MNNKTLRLIVSAALTMCIIFGIFLAINTPISVRGDILSPQARAVLGRPEEPTSSDGARKRLRF